MNPKAIHYLSLARKAGRIEVGEEPVGAAARAGHARLILIASDAPDNTRRRAANFAAGTEQQLAILPFTKEEMGAALGRTVVSLAAMTDPAMALAFLKALDMDSQYANAIERLAVKAARMRRHQQEEKAHQKNLRTGKFRREHQQKQAAEALCPNEQKPRESGRPGNGEKQQNAGFRKAEPRRYDKPAGGEKPYAGAKTAGKRDYAGKGQRSAGRTARSNAGRKYTAGNKTAGRGSGKKTHGGAEV